MHDEELHGGLDVPHGLGNELAHQAVHHGLGHAEVHDEEVQHDGLDVPHGLGNEELAHQGHHGLGNETHHGLGNHGAWQHGEQALSGRRHSQNHQNHHRVPATVLPVEGSLVDGPARDRPNLKQVELVVAAVEVNKVDHPQIPSSYHLWPVHSIFHQNWNICLQKKVNSNVAPKQAIPLYIYIYIQLYKIYSHESGVWVDTQHNLGGFPDPCLLLIKWAL